MATRTHWISRICVSGLLLVAAVALSGCTPRPDGPGPAAEKFFGALAVGDTATAAQLSDNPNEAREALNAAWAGLQATHLDAQILSAKYAEDTGTVGYRFTWHLPKNRTWTYDGQLKMARDEGRWEVRWTTTGLHPKLGEHQTFALRADAPRRASVNELGGSDVLAPGYLYHYTLDATQAGRAALIGTAHAIVDVLRPFNDALNDPQLLAEQASSATQPVDLVTLHPDDNDKVFPAIGRLPGIVITPAGRDAADRPAFRVGRHQRGEEGRGRPTRRPGGLAGGQRQPERCRRRSAARGRQGRRRRRSRSPSTGRCRTPLSARWTPGRQSDDRRDQAVDRGDPRDRAERGRRRRRPAGHQRPVPARVDVQDGHRRRRHRPRHGHPQHDAGLPGPSRHRAPHHPQLRRLRPRRGARCRARSPVPATPRSPSWAAGCRRAG